MTGTSQPAASLDPFDLAKFHLKFREHFTNIFAPAARTFADTRHKNNINLLFFYWLYHQLYVDKMIVDNPLEFTACDEAKLESLAQVCVEIEGNSTERAKTIYETQMFIRKWGFLELKIGHFLLRNRVF